MRPSNDDKKNYRPDSGEASRAGRKRRLFGAFSRAGQNQRDPAPQLRRISVARILAVGLPLLVITVILAVSISATRMAPSTIVAVLLDAIGVSTGIEYPPTAYTVIMQIRLPRILAALFAGGGLAVAGTIMQGLFRNPLAEPGILGVSAGASLGALVALVTGVGSFFALPAYAFVGALLAVGIILALSLLTKGSGQTVTLIMSGMAVSALFSALSSLVLTMGNEYQVASYIFWTMGGLSNRRWEHVTAIAPVAVLVLLIVFYRARDLDIMLLGDEEARALGVAPGRTRLLMIILASLSTAAIVSVTGPIGFVGLIVPHIMRLIVGPAHRPLVVASSIGGSIFLIFCDLITRVLSRPTGAELSAGVVTALIGAPYFLFLLFKSARRGGRLT